MLEVWHCSFDELISKHTQGQMVLLASGRAVYQEMQNEEVKRATKDKSKPPEFSNTGISDNKKVIQVPQFTSASQANEYLTMHGF